MPPQVSKSSLLVNSLSSQDESNMRAIGHASKPFSPSPIDQYAVWTKAHSTGAEGAQPIVLPRLCIAKTIPSSFLV